MQGAGRWRLGHWAPPGLDEKAVATSSAQLLSAGCDNWSSYDSAVPPSLEQVKTCYKAEKTIHLTSDCLYTWLSAQFSGGLVRATQLVSASHPNPSLRRH